MWTLSVLSLVIVAALCAFGVFHRAYKDNLMQCIGMGLLFIASCSRVAWIWRTEITDPSWVILHISMAVYAIGTAQKVALWHGRENGWGWLRRLDRWMLSKQTDAGAFDDRPHHHSGR